MPLRAWILLRARLAGERGENLPVAPLLLHGLIASVFGWIAGSELPPYGYGIYMLTITGTLVALPLLGEFNHLLRADAAEDWVAALPVTPRDLRVARAAHVGLVLVWLSLGSLLPAIYFVPEGAGLAGRLALAAGGLALVATLASGLFAVQALLGERAESALVLLQTGLFAGAVGGLVIGARSFATLAELSGLGDATWTWAFPPGWFAGPLGGGGASAFLLPGAAFLAASLLPIVLTPAPQARGGRRQTPFTRLLAPLRALAARVWVRRDERAVFELVFDALPLERELVLRTYPLIGVPIAFIAIGAADTTDVTRTDLFAVLFFTACIYLPVLLLHVPASESFRARWILETHPTAPGAVAGAVIKAVALRFLVPLYAALAAIAWAQAGLAVVLRLALPGYLISLLVLRMLYRSTVRDLPLSVEPDRLQTKYDWSGMVMANGIALTIAAVLVNRYLPSLTAGLVLSACLLAVELFAERGMRAGAAATMRA